MTTITPVKTTEFCVTLGYCAEDWADSETVDGDINYDTQPVATRTVAVALPSDATPFDIYCSADALINDSDVIAELEAEGGTGYDGDGILIEFDGKEYRNSYDAVSFGTTWDEFHAS